MLSSELSLDLGICHELFHSMVVSSVGWQLYFLLTLWVINMSNLAFHQGGRRNVG